MTQSELVARLGHHRACERVRSSGQPDSEVQICRQLPFRSVGPRENVSGPPAHANPARTEFGDVAAGAGVPFDFGRSSDGAVQGTTMMFRLQGIDAAKVRANPKEAARVFSLRKKLRDEGKFPQFLEMAARSYLSSPRDPAVSYNMCPVAGNPLDEEELTRLSAQGREQVYQYVDLWRKEMPGFESANVSQMGFGLGVRESRRLCGLKTLDAQMVVKAVRQPDAIGHGFWMIDIA
jgi:hypothetical protein